MQTGTHVRKPTSCLLVDETAAMLDLDEAVSERLAKASGLMTCLIAEDQYRIVSDEVLANALWTAQGLIEEAKALQQLLSERVRGHEELIRDMIMDEIEVHGRQGKKYRKEARQ